MAATAFLHQGAMRRAVDVHSWDGMFQHAGRADEDEAAQRCGFALPDTRYGTFTT